MKVENLMIGDWVYLINTIHNVSFPDNGVFKMKAIRLLILLLKQQLYLKIVYHIILTN